MSNRAIIYLRQSLDTTGEQLGVQRQEAECRRLCEQRGLEVVQVITDNSVSATYGERPGWQKLLEALDAGIADVAVVYRLDRLLRRMTELEQLVELVERTGTGIATVQGDIDLTNSQGRLLARILASVARAEVETKSERHRLANQQKAAMGKPHASRRPFGYMMGYEAIQEDEAAIYREMVRRVVSGRSCKDVAYWLNEQGHQTTQGKLFYPITVRNMLRSPRYVAIREYKGVQYPGVWLPLIEREQWDRLQLALRLREGDNRVITEGYTGRKYLLTGMLICGRCGNRLTGTRVRDRESAPIRRIYTCRSQGDTQKRGGCSLRRNADALDDWIKEAMLYRLDTEELGKLLADSAYDDRSLGQLLSERQIMQDRLTALVDDYATGLLDRAQFARAKQKAEAELQRIDTEIERQNRSRTASGLVPAGVSVRKAWDECGSDEWRRSLLRLLIERITVNPGNTKPLVTLSDGRRARFDARLIEISWLN